MDVIGEVKHRHTLGKLQQVAFRCENVDFLLIKIGLELVHHLKIVAGFKC